MKQPKFQVGDVVQYISRMSGKCIIPKTHVLSVVYREKGMVQCCVTGSIRIARSYWAYEVAGNRTFVAETSLHPYPQQKHEPAEFTFSALMDDLKSGVSA